MTLHTLSVLVENKPGVLARVSQLFTRRGFNIDSLAVGETEHPEVSRITIVVNAEQSPLEQVTKQLNKLVNVLKIVELEPDASIQRELLLVKVRADRTQRTQVMETVTMFRAQSRGRRGRHPHDRSHRYGRRSSTRCCATLSRSGSRKWCSPASSRSGGAPARSPRPPCGPRSRPAATSQRAAERTAPDIARAASRSV